MGEAQRAPAGSSTVLVRSFLEAPRDPSHGPVTPLFQLENYISDHERTLKEISASLSLFLPLKFTKPNFNVYHLPPPSPPVPLCLPHSFSHSRVYVCLSLPLSLTQTEILTHTHTHTHFHTHTYTHTLAIIRITRHTLALIRITCLVLLFLLLL